MSIKKQPTLWLKDSEPSRTTGCPEEAMVILVKHEATVVLISHSMEGPKLKQNKLRTDNTGTLGV